MYRCSLAYHVCNTILHTPFHILSVCGGPFVSFTGSLVSCRCTIHSGGAKPQIQAHQLLSAQTSSKWCKFDTPTKVDLIIAAFYRAGLLTLKKAHNRTQPGTGLNVLNKLMKSTHKTQAGHDKNLYSCETRPS